MKSSLDSGRILLAAVFAAGLLSHPAAARAATPNKPGGIQWRPWTDDLFDNARKENKLVILDLEAVWCHWCHVMEETTYADPRVKELITTKFIPVRVDQDSRPDLSNRYEDYGWPATIIFDPKGKELAKRSGYIAPGPMAAMLESFIKDPTPGPSVREEKKISFPAQGSLPDALRKELQETFRSTYDRRLGAWGTVHKFIDSDSVEYAMALAAAGDAEATTMAQTTLDNNRKIIDPAWGGVYQYSVRDWDDPHFEKIMSYQAANIRAYSEAYALWKRPEDLKSARDVYRYLETFLSSPEGAFYTSQDADLVKGEHSADFFALSNGERRKKGIPAVDKNRYSRENGWAIEAIAYLYSVTADPQVLAKAEKAAAWIIANRSLKKGGFRHDEKDKAGPYLGDTLAMARAFFRLYSVTGKREWLGRALESAEFIESTFRDSAAGYVTAASATAGFRAKGTRDENVAFARLAINLYHATGKESYRKQAEHAMRFISAPEIAGRLPAASPLLVDMELSNDPAHIIVIGPKSDEKAKELFLTGLAAYPLGYKRMEWWDRAEGPMPNPDVQYPELPQPAAFLCVNQRCSLPLFTREKLLKRINAPR